MSVPILKKNHSGMGFEPWGDPYGTGGPLHVVRARAIDSQTVRVAFDEPPLFRSRTGNNDAQNPLNYSVDIITGEGTKPQVVGVSPALVLPGAPVVYVDPERGVDVHTDRPLVVGIEYKVTVVNVLAAAGGALGAPYDANFMGVFRQSQVNPALRVTQFTDFKFDMFQKTGGAYVFTDSGDIDVDNGLPNIRKRILRRVSTPKNSFRHLPGYGTDIAHKGPLSVRQLIPMKQDLLQQIKQEPDVLAADVSIQLQGGNDLAILQIKAKTARGVLEVEVSRSGDGLIMVV